MKEQTKVSPRSHPEFAFPEGARYTWRNVVGVRWGQEVSGSGERTLVGTELPDGEVTLQARGVPRVRVQFDRERIERVYLNWHAPASRANIELFLPEKELKPGDSVTMQWTLLVE